MDEDTFALQPVPPQEILPGNYCYSCFATQVEDALDAYNAKVERAKNINLFYKSQSKESRFVRRTEKPVEVRDCGDREDVIMRLAYLAVEAGRNALVDVDVWSTKVRDGAYQTSRWSGRGIPADIDESQLQRRYTGAPN